MKQQSRSKLTKPTRTAAALKADAHLLAAGAGRAARAARAATDDEPTEPSPVAGTVGELWLYGVVGGYWFGFDAESVSRALRSLDVDTLYVRIHSPGGRAGEGVAIGNLLRNHKATVVTVVDGLAASAASVIAIAGDEVVMCPGSQMMLHDASMATWGNAAQLRRDAEWINKQSENYAGVYAHKAGGTPASWREVMLANEGDGTWYTAEEAVDAKLADEVGNRVATSSPPTAPEEQIDEDDDELLARIEHDLALLEQQVHPAARAAWTGSPLKPPTASADGSITTQGTETAMTFTSEQLTTMRDTLGLPETADEAAILAAVEAVVEDSLEDKPAPPDVPEGMVLVDSTVLDELRTGAQQGVEARQQQQAEARDRAIDAAIRAGKTTPARREHWATSWDADPEGTKALLDKLEAGLVPTTELGHGAAVDESKTEDDATYAALFGDEKTGV